MKEASCPERLDLAEVSLEWAEERKRISKPKVL